MPHAVKLSLVLLLTMSASPSKGDRPTPDEGKIELDLRRRDPASGEVKVTREMLDPKRVGVVVVDMWNWHWCKTAAMRVAALVPRMNVALDGARGMGMTVMLCPSDVVDNYVGWPQREAIFSHPKHEVPTLAEVVCPPPPDGGGCGCGKERCVVNYGWDGMNPGLRIDGRDPMPDTLQEVYSICKERGLTHLIYMGVHTQVCVLHKSMGLKNLKAAGLDCILARDLTDAHPGYRPETGFTPDSHTAEVVAHFERHLAPTVDLGGEMARLGKWEGSSAVDPVRITPWGTSARPHLFESDVTVTLSAPLEPSAEIYYTLDGSAPTRDAKRYKKPFTLAESSQVRAAAFDGDRAACGESEGRFFKLPARPPKPDVSLSDLTPVRWSAPGHTYRGRIRLPARDQPPQKDRSSEGAPLRLRGAEYAKGIGTHAPSQFMFEVKPEYERFVALAGVDERILQVSNGSNLARYPSVVFRVFIDGREAASSPVMRISEQPWRFDVRLPPGAKQISLCATDAGDGNREDLANWVDAGFVTDRSGRGIGR